MSSSRPPIVDRLLASGVVAVVRLDDPVPMPDVIRALIQGGVTAVEITMTVPGALALIEQAAETFGDAITLGVGSVLDAGGARDAIEAGARFVVSPVLEQPSDCWTVRASPARPPSVSLLIEEGGRA